MTDSRWDTGQGMKPDHLHLQPLQSLTHSFRTGDPPGMGTGRAEGAWPGDQGQPWETDGPQEWRLPSGSLSKEEPGRDYDGGLAEAACLEGHRKAVFPEGRSL